LPQAVFTPTGKGWTPKLPTGAGSNVHGQPRRRSRS
jgi:hypothetical protein